MSLYHVTDEVWVEKILREGLVGNPVVYLARSYFDALSIRRSQERLQERLGACAILEVQGEYELLIDPHVKTTPFGPVAFMIYQDVSPECLRRVYG